MTTLHASLLLPAQGRNRDGDEIVIDPFVLKFHIDGAVTASLPPVKNNHGVRLEVIVGTGLEGKSYPIGERGLTMHGRPRFLWRPFE